MGSRVNSRGKPRNRKEKIESLGRKETREIVTVTGTTGYRVLGLEPCVEGGPRFPCQPLA